MPWINQSASIPIDRKEFVSIIDDFVFNCPSSVMHQIKDKESKDKQKKKYEYRQVSARRSSFRQRGISGSLLTTILSQIRKPLQKNNAYYVMNTNESVTEQANMIVRSASLADPYFDFMVFHKRSDMSETESVYYYIRNAFAHGSFEVIDTQNEEQIYKLQSKKEDTVKAQMRLKESTLKKIACLSRYTPQQIKSMQKKHITTKRQKEKNSA